MKTQLKTIMEHTRKRVKEAYNSAYYRLVANIQAAQERYGERCHAYLLFSFCVSKPTCHL